MNTPNATPARPPDMHLSLIGRSCAPFLPSLLFLGLCVWLGPPGASGGFWANLSRFCGLGLVVTYWGGWAAADVLVTRRTEGAELIRFGPAAGIFTWLAGWAAGRWAWAWSGQVKDPMDLVFNVLAFLLVSLPVLSVCVLAALVVICLPLLASASVTSAFLFIVGHAVALALVLMIRGAPTTFRKAVYHDLITAAARRNVETVYRTDAPVLKKIFPPELFAAMLNSALHDGMDVKAVWEAATRLINQLKEAVDRQAPQNPATADLLGQAAQIDQQIAELQQQIDSTRASGGNPHLLECELAALRQRRASLAISRD